MKIECPTDLFRTFETNLGSWVQVEGPEKDLLYKCLSLHLEFVDLICIDLPPVGNETLKSWESLETWCNSVHPNPDLFTNLIEVIDDLEGLEPSNVFPTSDDLTNKVLDLVKNSDEDTEVGFVEIQHDQKSLFLIFTGFDGWSLGHSDSVLVVSSLDQLTPDKGFIRVN